MLDPEALSQLISDLHGTKEELRRLYKASKNPGIPGVYENLKIALRALEDAEDALDELR